MAYSLYSNVLTDMTQHIDTSLQVFTHDLYARLITYLHWPLLLSLQLYLVVVGYGVMNGWFSIAWRSMATIVYKMGISIALIDQWDTFNRYILTPIVGGAEELSAVVSGSMPAHVLGHTAAAQASQLVLTEVTRVGMWLWHGGSLIHYSRLLAGICVWVCGLGVTLYGFVHMTIAHMVLYIMLALSPLFVLLTLFDRLSHLTWYWISVCLECILLMLFLSAVMSLSLSLVHQVFDLPYRDHAKSFKLVDVVPIVVVSVLSFAVMKKMLGWASFVSSGVVNFLKESVSAANMGDAWNVKFSELYRRSRRGGK